MAARQTGSQQNLPK